MSLPTLSVIIPHLNQPEALACCLEALASQKGQFFLSEIIVIDNNSDVFPDDVCRRFDNVTLLCETGPGPGPARNTGVLSSTGTILAFTDADCVPDAGWLAAITRHFQNVDHRDILGGAVGLKRTRGQRLSALEAYENIFSYRIEEYVKQHNFAGTGNLAMPRAIFDIVGPFGDIQTGEDLDWGQRAHKLGYKLAFDQDVVVFHQPRSNFSELERKWDRHIAHAYLDGRDKKFPRLRIALLAIAVVISPLAELPKVLTTTKVNGLRERLLALACLTRIRLYRGKRMLSVMTDKKAQAVLDRWNRKS